MGAGETFVYRTKESEEFVERWYDGVLERWPVEFAERRVETSYGSTYAIECGDPSAPPVILLQGVGMNSGTWREAMDVERLSARYHLFLVDIDTDRSAEILELMGNFPQKKDRFIVAPLPTLSDEELRSMEVPCVCYMGERDPFYKALKVKERFDAMGCSITVDVVEGQGHLLGQDFTACLEEGLSRPLERPE